MSEITKSEPTGGASDWSPESWKAHPVAQEVVYDDPLALADAVRRIAALPPLVTSWEVERLKLLLADAQAGRRFVLQGGDCAETFSDCVSHVIAIKLKIILQMSLVLIHGGNRPVVRIGRLAGQYAKPRSSGVEQQGNTSHPSYFGDLVNRQEFTESARRPDAELLVAGYQHAAATLNFIRALTAGGFADLHHPENWDLSYFERAEVPDTLRHEYRRTSRRLAEALRFMEALGENTVDELTRVEFFTSHEGLNLHYESAQTRTVPRRLGHYDLTTHIPWIGERTRALDGAHVEFFRGIRNPVGVKVGPDATGDDVVRLVERLNPLDERGKVVLITRMGAERIETSLPPLINAVARAGRTVLWLVDPMHGNTRTTASGVKTRRFEDILQEIERAFAVHTATGSHLGGVHFEMTGEDVTECLGGAAGLTETDLARNYQSLCDPRLNYGQALEMAFRIAQQMSDARSAPLSSKNKDL